MKQTISNRKVNRAITVFVVLLVIVISLVLTFTSCSTSNYIGKGYLAYIEKGKNSDFKKFDSAPGIDSLVISDFGNIIPGFNADSVFKGNNLFTIGTDTTFLYIEQKNRVQRANGKIKFNTISK